MRTIFIFGLGYVGTALAHQLSAAGWRIRGTTRRPAALASTTPADWQIFSFAAGHRLEDPATALTGVDAILSTIAPIDGTDPVMDAHADDLSGFAGWTGYLSATSVYPDMPHSICYEDTPPAPATARGVARVAAETRWQSQLDAELFRLAGIYGPGRSPFDSLRAGTARIITRKGQLFNRIHLDDICRVIIAALETPRRRRIINLADGTPASQGDVIRHAAQLIGVDPPRPERLEDAALSPMARSFYLASRHIGSRVIKPELGVDLRYPDYQSGLGAILAAETQPIAGSSDPLA